MPINKHNLWQANPSYAAIGLPLTSHEHCDLVIIGAGYSGLCAALHAAQQGMSVRVLEAHTLGFGGSGRNVGLVNAGLWTPPDEVEKTLGKVAGEKLNQALALAPKLVFSLIEKHQINCHPLQQGTLHCANNSAGLSQLKARLAQQMARQAPVSLLSLAQTAQHTGSSRFLGALLDPRAGTIQPLNYALGLAQAATSAGAVIHTHTPALSYQHSDQNSDQNSDQHNRKHWLVKTKNGSITANKLIHATNAYGSPSPSLDSKDFTPVNYVQFATQPLTPAQRASVLPNGHGCWDTNQVMSSFRMDPSGRLIIGGVGSLNDQTKHTHVNWAHRKLKHLFPQVTDYKFEYMWHGKIAMTADHLPKITPILTHGTHSTNGIRLYGYSGRGIGPGTLFGKAAAHWALTGDESQLPVALTTPKPEAFTRLKASYFDMGATLNHWFSCRL